MPEILVSLRRIDVVSVGEMEEFALSRRIIQFTLQEDRVRFMANSEAAERACLKISSRLLAIAEIIHDDLRRGRS